MPARPCRVPEWDGLLSEYFKDPSPPVFSFVVVDIETDRSRSRETMPWRRSDGSGALGASHGIGML